MSIYLWLLLGYVFLLSLRWTLPLLAAAASWALTPIVLPFVYVYKPVFNQWREKRNSQQPTEATEPSAEPLDPSGILFDRIKQAAAASGIDLNALFPLRGREAAELVAAAEAPAWEITLPLILKRAAGIKAEPLPLSESSQGSAPLPSMAAVNLPEPPKEAGVLVPSGDLRNGCDGR